MNTEQDLNIEFKGDSMLDHQTNLHTTREHVRLRGMQCTVQSLIPSQIFIWILSFEITEVLTLFEKQGVTAGLLAWTRSGPRAGWRSTTFRVARCTQYGKTSALR